MFYIDEVLIVQVTIWFDVVLDFQGVIMVRPVSSIHVILCNALLCLNSILSIEKGRRSKSIHFILTYMFAQIFTVSKQLLH